ncbi:MAG: hypothetical protein KAW12_20545 [Candidatus Aminicenantes bacterium]|nr:hypothetical protein [Candidatus Aminicenantes bacterium]
MKNKKLVGFSVLALFFVGLMFLSTYVSGEEECSCTDFSFDQCDACYFLDECDDWWVVSSYCANVYMPNTCILKWRVICFDGDEGGDPYTRYIFEYAHYCFECEQEGDPFE